ncbi:hypothetical protein Moror_13964 [Moniliophthora roreri MCA 2997]|uniref:Uncharacterized protein n=2 Tax=Moniliophthora roreri TaxID=221103 RepID=V2YTF4_MONRO|nr:hypothetical protein Moror_13964 [Moniliophthora roreri MCA 2997]
MPSDPWTFNLRAINKRTDSSASSSSEPSQSSSSPHRSSEDTEWSDFDLSSRNKDEEAKIQYKPNPFSIARINAATRDQARKSKAQDGNAQRQTQSVVQNDTSAGVRKAQHPAPQRPATTSQVPKLGARVSSNVSLKGTVRGFFGRKDRTTTGKPLEPHKTTALLTESSPSQPTSSRPHDDDTPLNNMPIKPYFANDASGYRNPDPGASSATPPLIGILSPTNMALKKEEDEDEDPYSPALLLSIHGQHPHVTSPEPTRSSAALTPIDKGLFKAEAIASPTLNSAFQHRQPPFAPALTTKSLNPTNPTNPPAGQTPVKLRIVPAPSAGSAVKRGPRSANRALKPLVPKGELLPHSGASVSSLGHSTYSPRETSSQSLRPRLNTDTRTLHTHDRTVGNRMLFGNGRQGDGNEDEEQQPYVPKEEDIQGVNDWMMAASAQISLVGTASIRQAESAESSRPALVVFPIDQNDRSDRTTDSVHASAPNQKDTQDVLLVKKRNWRMVKRNDEAEDLEWSTLGKRQKGDRCSGTFRLNWA